MFWRVLNLANGCVLLSFTNCDSGNGNSRSFVKTIVSYTTCVEIVLEIVFAFDFSIGTGWVSVEEYDE